MEILSTGEKIKRARIYKGYTLKDICEDKVSVSKMSCIENGKVNAEDWILSFVSEKLGVDVKYLNETIEEQITKNISILEKNKNAEYYESKLEYNLGFAEEYKYYNQAFKIMHLLFEHYLTINKLEKLQVAVSKYYHICQMTNSEENLSLYYMDIASYFYKTEEYIQAANYYNNVKRVAKEKQNTSLLVRTIFNEAACYIMLNNYQKAYEIAVHIPDLLEYFDSDLHRAEACHMLAMLALRMNRGNFEEYEKKSYELYSNNAEYKANAMFNFAVAMFKTDMNKKAVEYIKNALELHPKNDVNKLVKFMINCIGELIEHEYYEEAKEKCDEALNYSIELDNSKYIEKSYYFKSVILQKEKDYTMAEMYMNLSLDSLLKTGCKQEIYKRYMEIGSMYHEMGHTNDAIKYLSLAITLEKKI